MQICTCFSWRKQKLKIQNKIENIQYAIGYYHAVIYSYILVYISGAEIEIRNDSPYPEIGRVEISLTDPSNHMAICNSTWDIAKAHLVCRQLGYAEGAAQVFSVGDGTDQVITDLECPDGAASLADCTFETMEVEKAENCNIDQVAGVVCSSKSVYMNMLHKAHRKLCDATNPICQEIAILHQNNNMDFQPV